MSIFDRLFHRTPKTAKWAMSLNGWTPTFGQYGTNAYQFDVVQQALKCIVDEIKKLTPHILTKHLKLQFDNHHLHDLRHTFITRAQECGIRREYASMWAGHEPH